MLLMKLTGRKDKASIDSGWRDFDQICECFDLALSPEVIDWFEQQNGLMQAQSNRNADRGDLDEHELSLQ